MILRKDFLDKKQNPHTVDTKRIAKNTLMLYFRQLLVMLVHLYTVRIVLNTLGANDYGLYNVVAGIVAMFGFLSASMAAASQRYFSFSLGKKDRDELHKIFNLTIVIYAIITIIVIFFAETVGSWFVYTKLRVDSERFFIVKWVYQFSILSLVLTIMTIPFMAVLIAYEDMRIYAYVGIIEALLKLCVALILQVSPWDKLWLYSLLMLLVTIVTTTIYRTICKIKYKECKYKFYWNAVQAKDMMSFVGWNLIGSMADILKNQGNNILLNQYFAPVVNASRGIAMQVNGAVSSFSQNFSAALNPQIVKNYAAGNTEKMLSLIYRGCKLTYFLMLFFALPLIIEMDMILTLWLKKPPVYAIEFTRLILINALVGSLSYPISTAVQATGRVKVFQMVVGGIVLLNFPVVLIALVMGSGAVVVMIVDIVLAIIALFARVLLSKKLFRLPLLIFYKKVGIPVFSVTLLSLVGSLMFYMLVPRSFISSCCVIIMTIICTGVTSFFLGLTNQERNYLVASLRNKLKR